MKDINTLSVNSALQHFTVSVPASAIQGLKALKQARVLNYTWSSSTLQYKIMMNTALAIAQLVEYQVNGRNVPCQLSVQFLNWKCIFVSLGKRLIFFIVDT